VIQKYTDLNHPSPIFVINLMPILERINIRNEMRIKLSKVIIMRSEIRYQAIRIVSMGHRVFKHLMHCPIIHLPLLIGKIMIPIFKDRVILISIQLQVSRRKRKR
jgi:hypothetical protein